MNILNTVVEAINTDHGQKLIEYWKSLGVSTSFKGTNSKVNCFSQRYYGYLNGKFNIYTIQEVNDNKGIIITLEELKRNTGFPKVMWLAHTNDMSKAFKRVVIAKSDRSWIFVSKIEDMREFNTTPIDSMDLFTIQYGWDLDEKSEIVEVTLKEVAQLKGIDVSKIRIIDDYE